ncbi:hemoglobin [Paenibacillus anaericanus]|uniref:Globin n=1 Tax=Paenibacillus anaericanus TaxID=170367 RepID=A0A3S1DUB5_9BACL|nr:globin [Paenibacillus anaericanus]MDQ0089060.1 hemoglobin [Paenibacillus anaericanus]RUT45522.1 globin [Paenibacillus anaericanus]
MVLYDELGGQLGIRKVVESFYPKVKKDPLLAPLFTNDIDSIMEKQEMFLSQFFGGPDLYTSVFGHPRMRARHMPFTITRDHADAWLSCMSRALEETVESEELRHAVIERLKVSAYFFVNS